MLLQRVIDVHRVKDAEVFLRSTFTVEITTQTRCTPQHLLEQDSTASTADENQRIDFRDVDARGQQFDSDSDLRQRFILVATNQFSRAIHTSSNLFDEIMMDGVGTMFCLQGANQ